MAGSVFFFSCICGRLQFVLCIYCRVFWAVALAKAFGIGIFFLRPCSYLLSWRKYTGVGKWTGRSTGAVAVGGSRGQILGWTAMEWSGIFKLGLGVYITNVTTSPCAPLLVFLLQRTRYRLGC